MTATLTLFRPSILDPVEDADRTQLREPGFVHDRHRSAPCDGEQPQLREPGSAQVATPAPDFVSAPVTSPARDDDALQPTVQQGGGPTLDELIVGVWEDL